MISRDEILKGQICPQQYELNLENLLIALNKFRSLYGSPMIVTSGYRTPEHNLSIGGAKDSSHLYCQAADFADKDRKLCEWIISHPMSLIECGLWQEDPEHTKSWLHLQTRPALHRVFIP